MKQLWKLALSVALMSQAVLAQALELRPGAPTVYTIQPGDTLISIANQYLEDPSQWPELLQYNPNVRNPYKLYPGEILTLSLKNGSPHISISTGGTIKLTPQIRSSAINKAIPIIPLSVIKPFLNGALVVNQFELNSAPYIVAHADHHITTGAGDRIYVMGLPDTTVGTEYSIFRQGDAYKDPKTKKVLGYAAINVGAAQVQQSGNPATMLITTTTREVLTGDRLQPAYKGQINNDFIPSLPTMPVQGQIIAVLDGVTQISQYQIVVLDKGTQQGLRPGNLLDVYQQGESVKDPVTKKQVQLPNQRAGQLMVFRVFPQLSYGVVLTETSPIHTLDYVQVPKT